MQELTEEKDRSIVILNKALLPEQQAATSTGTTRGRKWSDEAIKKGLELRMLCGTTGYRKLIESLPLPSVRPLQERLWCPRPDRARSFREQAQLAATEDDRVGSAPLHIFSSQRHRCARLATLAVQWREKGEGRGEAAHPLWGGGR